MKEISFITYNIPLRKKEEIFEENSNVTPGIEKEAKV